MANQDEPRPLRDAAAPDSADDELSASRATRVRRVARGAAERAGHVADRVVDAGEALAQKIEPVVERVGPTVRAARHAPRPRRRTVQPLPNLYDAHPEVRFAPIRELGVDAIPVEEIRGTAVEGPAQRGTDFLPLPPMRSSNWAGRWQRIQRAVRELRVLPPIDVLKTAEGYWVVDGHNRVAAARKAGQVAIDALVTAVLLPGETLEWSPGSLAALVEGGDLVQAAASGRLTPGTELGRTVRAADFDPGGPEASEPFDSGSADRSGPAANEPVADDEGSPAEERASERDP